MLQERQWLVQRNRGFGYENLDPRHYYAAYIFDQPEDHQYDIDVLVREAKKLGRPIRYWWLSDAVTQMGAPDRIIISVHHPTAGASLELHNQLYTQKASIDEMGRATFEEYVMYSWPLHHLGNILTPEGEPVFPKYVSPQNLEADVSSLREIDPLVTLTYGDLQAVALTALGRYLNEGEVGQTTAELQEFFDRKVTQLLVGLEQRRELAMEQPALETGGLTEAEYLVYYSLGGLALMRASSGASASEKLFAILHGLIGRSESEGVKPQEASQVRLHDLEIAIESVEALEFATEEL